LFSTTRFISINLLLLSITASIIGIILLTTGSILFTISVMLTKGKSNMTFSVIHFISLRHPLIFYGLPGIVFLIVSGYFAYNALDYFSSYRYVTTLLTNKLFVTVSAAIIGIILLANGSISYSISAILKGKLRTDL